ncbi:hypothetical protein H6P81_010030 [Aristolochia fimbriata]|uniref:Uncharacterized protein n=1 Tax=Aristolochia fimbriata TaxID=158543 RepID=A0AAV7EMN0_ARIFI|nr:hypothetical protein H6P81_010030 [Aristolochia fimbriata]
MRVELIWTGPWPVAASRDQPRGAAACGGYTNAWVYPFVVTYVDKRTKQAAERKKAARIAGSGRGAASRFIRRKWRRVSWREDECSTSSRKGSRFLLRGRPSDITASSTLCLRNKSSLPEQSKPGKFVWFLLSLLGLFSVTEDGYGAAGNSPVSGTRAK